MRSRRGSLVVVGLGICTPSQITPEALDALTRADVVLFLSIDKVTAQWVRGKNPNSVELNDCYRRGRRRLHAYRRMVAKILLEVRAGRRVCAAFYGHPGILVRPGHDAIRAAKRSGFRAQMLPAISAADCLFADLGIDPGAAGLQSYDATQFLVCGRQPDPTTTLILWQIGALGVQGIEQRTTPRSLEMLKSVLITVYGLRHRVWIYEAASHPIQTPVRVHVALGRLNVEQLTPLSTLCVPRKYSPLPHVAVSRILRIAARERIDE